GVGRAHGADVVRPGDEQRGGDLKLGVLGEADDPELSALLAAGADGEDALAQLEVGGAAHRLTGRLGQPAGAQPLWGTEARVVVADDRGVAGAALARRARGERALPDAPGRVDALDPPHGAL